MGDLGAQLINLPGKMAEGLRQELQELNTYKVGWIIYYGLPSTLQVIAIWLRYALPPLYSKINPLHISSQ